MMPSAYISNHDVSLAMTPTTYKGFNRLDWIDEVTSDIGRVFLGVTMDCFSCHNGAGHADSFNLFLAQHEENRLLAAGGVLWKDAEPSEAATAVAAISRTASACSTTWLLATTPETTEIIITPAENRFPRDGRAYEPAFLLTGEKPKPGERSA